MIDVLGLGSVALDDLLLIDEWPAADTKVRVARRTQRLGGLTGHALVAATKAGARCAYAGCLGTDDDSLAAARALEAAGIDTRFAVRAGANGIVRSVIVSAVLPGTRNVFSHATGRTGAHDLSPSAEVIGDAQVLFVDHHGVSGSIRAAGLAREAGCAVVADLERDDHVRFGELLAAVDHLILSSAFARRITGTATPAEAVQHLWNSDREVVIVTDGGEGCWWRDSAHVVPQHFPALRVEVRDTSGCGDVFHGVYAARLASSTPLDERLRAATEAAGRHAAA